MDYISSEPEFFKFLTEVENITKNTRTNYISWLRFLSQFHLIDDKISEFTISKIIEMEIIAKNERSFYTKEKDISNFKSALNKYLKYIKEDFSTKIYVEIEDKVAEIKNDTKIPITEKQNLTLSRIGQGKFRNELINYWFGCSISKLDKVNLLVASHIKPWKDCDSKSRLSAENGIPLVATLDALFDKGLITFEDDGAMLVSKKISKSDCKLFDIPKNLSKAPSEKMKNYLRYHRLKVFKGKKWVG